VLKVEVLKAFLKIKLILANLDERSLEGRLLKGDVLQALI
jgi:hypothetical protein